MTSISKLIGLLAILILFACNTARVYVVTTIAGTGAAGSKNGPAMESTFKYPQGIAVDHDGNVFVADLGNDLVRKIDKSGIVTTYINGDQKLQLLDSLSGHDFFSKSANDLIFDKEGNLIICTLQNIWKIDKQEKLQRIVGDGGILKVNGESPGLHASLWNAHGMAVDHNNNIYVADYGHQLIRKILPSGIIITIGAKTKDSVNFYLKTKPPHFDYPSGITVDSKGNLFIAEAYNNTIVKYTSNGEVSIFAGNGQQDTANGYGTKAGFNWPQGLTIDRYDNIYVADAGNNLIRKITPNGLVSTIAGSGKEGSSNGHALQASFNKPTSLTIDEDGNIYIAELKNHKIRKLSLESIHKN